MSHLRKALFCSLVFCMAITWRLSALAFSGAASVVVEGRIADLGPRYELIMLSTHKQISARLLQSVLFDGRFALVQTQVSRLRLSGAAKQVNSEEEWYLNERNTMAVDCMSFPWRVSIIKQEINTLLDDDRSPVWKILSSNGDFLGSNLGALEFHRPFEIDASIPVLPQDFKVPDELRVASEFACEALSSQGRSVSVSGIASGIRKNGGYRDLHRMRCKMGGVSMVSGADLIFYYSPVGNSLLLGGKWIYDGSLHEDYMAMSDGDVDLRLIRKTGDIRVVSRTESKTIGVGVCRTELIHDF